MNERFTDKARHAISRCAEIAGSLGHTYIGSEHLLLSLIEEEMSSAELVFKKHNLTPERFRRAICEYSGIGVESSVGAADMTPRCRKILERSHLCASRVSSLLIGTEHILCALTEEKECIAQKLLKSIGVNTGLLKEDTQALVKSRSSDNITKPRDNATLKQYGKNFTELAKKGYFDPVVGRDKETERVIRVLCRKNKNNPCLIGEAGVGKSAIVEGLAQRIAEGRVPQALKGASIISVDLTSMVAGAKYRGDFEERIKNIVNEATNNKSVILFIDEIHTIVGAGAAEGAIDASNILKPQLSRGELQIIGATTYSEYRKYIEKDPALERRFQPIAVEEPTKDETVSMLEGIKSRYEAHHGIVISNEAIKACVELSVKYLSDRFLPDKAIDVMDEACAYAATKHHENNRIFENKGDIIRQKIPEVELAVRDCDFDMAESISNELQQDALLFPTDNIAESVSVDDVKYIVSEMSGVSLCDIRTGIDYDNLAHKLQSTVIGQEKAVRSVVAALKRGQIGLTGSDRPKGCFLFVGESGVGKTALAAALAAEVYQNQNALLRYDMSEFSEKHSVSKLVGAPPGYAGYESGGTLTEEVRKKPNAVILFDEIEKANREVQNLFLQIADNGYLTDSSGRRVSFRNTIIIMTSNAMDRRVNPSEPLGFAKTTSSTDGGTDLSKNFSPEFLNRFDEIIRFDTLTRDTLYKIAKNRIDRIADVLLSQGIRLDYSDSVIDHIVSKTADPKMGARAVIRYIASYIERVISDAIINTRMLTCIKLDTNCDADEISVVTVADGYNEEVTI